VGKLPTGAWAEHQDELAQWSGSVWTFRSRGYTDVCKNLSTGIINTSNIIPDDNRNGGLLTGEIQCSRLLASGLAFNEIDTFATGDITRLDRRSLYVCEESVPRVLTLNAGASGNTSVVHVINKGSSTLTCSDTGFSLVLQAGESAILQGTGIATSGNQWVVIGISVKSPSYAKIYRTAAGVVQTIPTGTAWTKLTPFDTNDTYYAGSTPDQANDRIVIGRAGRYHVTFSRSLSVGSANFNTYVAILKNGSAVASSIRQKRITATSTAIDSELTDDITFASGDVVTVGTYNDSASPVDLTYLQAALSVHSID